MATSFDFGEGAEVATGSIVPGIPGECDANSHDFSICLNPGVLLKQSMISMFVSQREKLMTSGGNGINNISTVANIPKLGEALKTHLEEAPCLVIHYGDRKCDFETMVIFVRSISAKSKGNIPIAFYAKDAKGPDFITVNDVPDRILNGVSVFYHAEDPDEFEAFGAVLSRCATMATEKRLDISPIQFIVVIDRTAGFILGKTIRDEGDDRLFLVDGGEREQGKAQHDKGFELATRYLPQVEAIQEVPPTMIRKEWETKMSTHIFRNAHFPPSAIDSAKFPLDHLGFFLAFHPFGPSYVIAMSLLPDKGSLVKKLLEAWVSTSLGSPVRFIKAD